MLVTILVSFMFVNVLVSTFLSFIHASDRFSFYIYQFPSC